ncbi:hypothetical protein [Salirhabdus sp. Marseille-P4669]|uniref:hypothetical protein n=1 Tax=Salirhabdus sp. Marseille-P4669 TaxID=2042310 RepID=UPI0011AF47B4|nr:hypothetical protein [Salirhabdus sp. Marseille-P4669]
MNKERIKKALNDEIFAQNPFDENMKEQMFSKIYFSEEKISSKNRYRLVFHSILTLSVGVVIGIGGFLFLANTKDSQNPNLDQDYSGKEIVEDRKVTVPNEEPKDETIRLAEQILTNPVALEAFLLIPKETQHHFNESLLFQYNQNAKFREKVALGIKKAKNLSVYKLEGLSYEMPQNGFQADFNDHGEIVYIVGEVWVKIKGEFHTLDHDRKEQLTDVLSEIGREFVTGNGELATPDNQGVFKASVTWSEVPEDVKLRIQNDIEKKLNGIKTLLENDQDNQTYLYNELRDFESRYKKVLNQELTMESFVEYLGVNFQFFIFSYMLLEPRPVEVLAEPKYRTNEEQVDIVLSGPR